MAQAPCPRRGRPSRRFHHLGVALTKLRAAGKRNLPRSVDASPRAGSTHRTSARVAELADALDSGSSSRKGVEVRVLSRAPYFAFHAFLTAASTVSAFSAPSGVSSCLKYTNTSPALASFAILSSSALRSFAEYFSLRSRKYAKS